MNLFMIKVRVSLRLHNRNNIGLDVKNPLFGGLRTTKAQTSLRIRSLISAFVIHLLKSI